MSGIYDVTAAGRAFQRAATRLLAYLSNAVCHDLVRALGGTSSSASAIIQISISGGRIGAMPA